MFCYFKDALLREDGRTKLSPTKALLVLLRNLLLSREPIYGLGEWAARYVPDLMDLTENEVGLLNDARAEITKGLAENERVVLAPESNLTDGARVKVQ